MTEKLPRDMTENEVRYHCAALYDEIERLTAENERLRKIEWAAQTVLKTFRDDEAAGYHTKDREYAISILGKFVDQQIRPQPDIHGEK